ncbi:Ros/MucR family transcriptional regulator [Ameyamaea chiangmaiensis NBRC 103196]|uniref:MucR family transcriptional regulator n=1 Tax=Ameyamaea chiangmaiensis TaxID=442969 RepID=A0A850P615_9PROT|nr:MucR family transcriptional regulator [Ameyamaea chiangmaiensis]MBS4075043.1 MucR family transcriptional regulator [Ameyamaea chiangmaiensis]NVN40085.1 MucR family transcriptional regulator [Ameyamaea chiangmaiensis]GBQ65670.1 Ros/MucR family transcriptional regulator [Ameyamaea chiangmaiensis NBRC 103196]
MPLAHQPSVPALTAQIVAAYVSGNPVGAETLAQVIASVHEALTDVASSAGCVAALSPTPAVPPRRSVFDDYIVCLEDGKKLKILRRHLKSAYGMTPEQYRARWDLPNDYPMVAPNYADERSRLARRNGLGTRRS